MMTLPTRFGQIGVLFGLLSLASLPAYATTVEVDATIDDKTVETVPSLSLDWQQGGKTDYEHQQAGMGYGIKFYSALGVADRYVYNLGKSQWADGIDDADLPAVMNLAIAEIEEMEKQGYYQDVKLLPVRVVEINQTPFLATYGGFKALDNIHFTGILITGFDGNILKYRISFDPGVFDHPDIDIIKVMNDFVAQDYANLKSSF